MNKAIIINEKKMFRKVEQLNFLYRFHPKKF